MYRFERSDRILIAGGTGFMGSHLTRRCLQDTAHVFCISFTGKSDKAAGEKKASIMKGDLVDKDQLRSLLAGQSFDYVFNLSGYIDHAHFLRGGRKALEAHFTGLMNLVEYLDTAKLKGFVQVGSSDEYGSLPAPQKETMRECPISPYSIAKTAATHFVQTLAATEGFPGVVLRPFLVYGTGQDMKRLLPQIITACLKDQEFKTSEGKQLRDFCYVADVAEAMIQAALTPAAKGHVINIGSGIPVAIKDVVLKVVQMSGGGKPLWGTVLYRPGENMALYPDITLAKNLLDWSPQINFDEGLKRTIAYCRTIID
jgi:nucleoside-diphosphate-sugar epimerase